MERKTGERVLIVCAAVLLVTAAVVTYALVRRRSRQRASSGTVGIVSVLVYARDLPKGSGLKSAPFIQILLVTEQVRETDVVGRDLKRVIHLRLRRGVREGDTVSWDDFESK